MARHLSGGILAAVAALPLLLTGCSGDATSRPSAERTTEPGEAHDFVLLLDDDTDPDQVEGKAGAYALTARGARTAPLAVLDAPEGFSNFGFFALWPLHSDEEGAEQAEEPLRSVQYWTVHGVFPEPCNRDAHAAPQSGDSVQELAAALAAQKLTSTSKPVPVSLDGHQGLYLELTVPPEVEIERCRDGYYLFWEGAPGDAQHPASVPGALERTWILDVDGERVVLVAITDPGVTDAQAEELQDMVESIRFVQPR